MQLYCLSVADHDVAKTQLLSEVFAGADHPPGTGPFNGKQIQMWGLLQDRLTQWRSLNTWVIHFIGMFTESPSTSPLGKPSGSI